jgi:putative transposase
MGRYARQTIADVPYHIINRGNNHQPIFFNDDDYHFFLESLELAKEKYPCKIYSFVFMTNHVHLILEPVSDNNNLAYFMKYISQKHGQYINKHYKRSGTLWEGRFKSSPISSDRYLLSCSRYIEMNPVRAGIVEKPDDYIFSSYGAKVGLGLRELKCLDYDAFYNSLGNTTDERQIAYQRWFYESIPEAEWDLIREAVQRNWAYGNNRFKEQMEMALDRKFELKKAGRRPKM